jgi:hypothetical protein
VPARSVTVSKCTTSGHPDLQSVPALYATLAGRAANLVVELSRCAAARIGSITGAVCFLAVRLVKA